MKKDKWALLASKLPEGKWFSDDSIDILKECGFDVTKVYETSGVIFNIFDSGRRDKGVMIEYVLFFSTKDMPAMGINPEHERKTSPLHDNYIRTIRAGLFMGGAAFMSKSGIDKFRITTESGFKSKNPSILLQILSDETTGAK